MKKSIIVFGIKEYDEKRADIQARYNIIGVSDFDGEKKRCLTDGETYISPNKIKDYNYDYVLLMGEQKVDMFNFLLAHGVSVVNIKLDFLEFGDTSAFHGQNFEDLKLTIILNSLGIGMKDVVYLELGTNNPVVYNNTYYLYKHGARGVLVEPNPNLKQYIEFVRKEDILLQKAIDLTSGKTIKFYEMTGDMVSTTDIDTIDNAFLENEAAFELKKVHEVETISFNEILDAMTLPPVVICIDIEGKDYQVIKSINFSQYHPLIIVAEMQAWGAKTQQGQAIVDYLRTQGYEPSVLSSGLNGIFLRADVAKIVEPINRTFLKSCFLDVL